MRDIPREQVLGRLRQENVWWEAPHEIPAPFNEWRPRSYLDVFFPHFENRDVRRALVLMGPRRVGKTVMLHHALQRLLRRGVDPKSICYVSVDHPIYNGLRLDELIELYEEAAGVSTLEDECLVVFDEVQYLRDWEVHVKALVDRHDKLRIVASGSAAAALRLKSAESGAGRITDFLLPPLTFHEYLTLKEEDELVRVDDDAEDWEKFHVPDIDALNSAFVEYLNYGGYPEVVLSSAIRADPARYVKSDIIDKVLLRDLPSLYGIHDIQELNSLFTTLAFNTAGEVSLEGLSKKSGVAKNTIKKYIEYLEAAFLVRVIHRLDRNAKRFKRANYFKVYLTNPSVRSALFSAVEEDGDAIGSLVETAIFAQWFHIDYPLHYARWSGGEVDMVYLNHQLAPDWVVEAKWSDRDFERSPSCERLVSFCSTNGVDRATVTTRTRRFRFEQEGVEIHGRPASEHCFVVGYNLLRSKGDGSG